MSSEETSKVHPVDGPELTELLNKIEQGIVGSIQKGAEQLEASTQKAVALTRSNEDALHPTFVSNEAEKQRWEFINPIILCKDNWMGARPEGIRINKGTYKIDYSVSTPGAEGTGLGIFDAETKKYEKLIFWHGASNQSINISGIQHFSVNSPSIINITDDRGNFNPTTGHSIYIVTLFRAKITPD